MQAVNEALNVKLGKVRIRMAVNIGTAALLSKNERSPLCCWELRMHVFEPRPSSTFISGKIVKTRYLNRLFKLFIGLLLSISGHAYAVTYCVTTSGLPQALTFPSSVKVTSDLKAGDAIPGTRRSFSISGTCALDVSLFQNRIEVGSNIVVCTFDTGSTEVMTGVYTTSVPGIGMRLFDGSGNPVTNAGGILCRSKISTIGAGGSFAFSGSLELVRINGTIPNNAVLSGSPVGNGAFLFGVYLTGINLNQDVGAGGTGSSSIYPSGNIVFQNIGCTTDYPTSVGLPNISVANLPSIGSVSGATRFDIGVTCDQNAIASISIDPASDVTAINAATGLISVRSGSGSAGGVGIQILDRNLNPFALQTFNTLGNVSANLRTAFPFVARYNRIGTLSPGIVTTAIVFTMSYR